MVISSSIDPSRRLDLYFRINRAGSKTFTFLNSSGSAYNIFDVYTDYDFAFVLKEYPGAKKNLLYLDFGNGLSFTADNKLRADYTAAGTNIKEGQKYWELYLIAQEKTWLNGFAYFHNGVFDGVGNEDNSITITESGDDITITINDSIGVSGTYTPTATPVLNIDSVTTFKSQYMRVGNTVTVSGRVDVDSSLLAANNEFRMTIPISSDFTATTDLAGVHIRDSGSVSGAIYADITNNEAYFVNQGSSLSLRTYFYVYTYEVK